MENLQEVRTMSDANVNPQAEPEQREIIEEHLQEYKVLDNYPDTIDILSFFNITVKIRCHSDCNFEGGVIKIYDQEDKEAGSGNLEKAPPHLYDEDFPWWHTVIKLQAPAKRGDYTWKAKFTGLLIEVIDEEADEGAPQGENAVFGEQGRPPEPEPKHFLKHPEAEETFSIHVRAHLLSVNVWGVPDPVVSGEKFKVSISVACSSSCNLAQLPIIVSDEKGDERGRGLLGDELLAHTDHSYWTELELRGPAEERFYTWQITAEKPENGYPHDLEPVALPFMVGPPSKFTVTITVINKYDRLPVDEAQIMIGLRRGVTGKDGKCTMSIAEGEQELMVTKQDFIRIEKTINVTEDMTLDLDFEYSPPV
jgi:hypothetical protein